jgi:hypothetical protein
VVWFGISPVQVDVRWPRFGKSLEIVIAVVRFCKSLEGISFSSFSVYFHKAIYD